MGEVCPACACTQWVPMRGVAASVIEACVGCGMGRTTPPPDAQSQDYGCTSFAGTRELRRTMWRAFANSQLDLLERFRPVGVTGPCLVDVGCSVGTLVEVANMRGWRAVGFEPDVTACGLAARHGAPVVNSFFSESSVLANKVRAVTISHVLEHVENPVMFLQGISAAMAPGAALLVVCPAMDGWIARIQGARWYGYAISQHHWHFTTRTLARVVTNAGFELVEVHKRAMSYSLPVLTQRTQPAMDMALRAAAKLGLGDEVAVLGFRPFKVAEGLR